jgi:hypothetical protein
VPDRPSAEEAAVLAVEFVDAQHGDAALVESPDGAVMLDSALVDLRRPIGSI